jgi:hypothetical protein
MWSQLPVIHYFQVFTDSEHWRLVNNLSLNNYLSIYYMTPGRFGAKKIQKLSFWVKIFPMNQIRRKKLPGK